MRRYGPRLLRTHDCYAHESPLVPCVKGGWVFYEDVRVMIEHAQEVARLLELGDHRLLVGDGPCGAQNAAVALTSKESAELYQACKKIAAEAAGS